MSVFQNCAGVFRLNIKTSPIAPGGYHTVQGIGISIPFGLADYAGSNRPGMPCGRCIMDAGVAGFYHRSPVGNCFKSCFYGSAMRKNTFGYGKPARYRIGYDVYVQISAGKN
jgi:hypothetical protein